MGTNVSSSFFELTPGWSFGDARASRRCSLVSWIHPGWLLCVRSGLRKTHGQSAPFCTFRYYSPYVSLSTWSTGKYSYNAIEQNDNNKSTWLCFPSSVTGKPVKLFLKFPDQVTANKMGPPRGAPRGRGGNGPFRYFGGALTLFRSRKRRARREPRRRRRRRM